MSAHKTGPVLYAEKITKTFPGVRALDAVDLSVYAGKVNAIVGENGAGKSTLMNILSGVYTGYEGDIYLYGEHTVFAGPADAQKRGIAIIHQELYLVANLSVAENIFLGREYTTRLGLIDYPRLHREAETLLKQLELDIDPRTRLGDLRVGRRQLVEIAKALSLRARTVIMDEPTSALTSQEIRILFKTIHRLKQQGVAVVYITHKLDELFEIADNLTVLRDGKRIIQQDFSGITHDEIVSLMVGRKIENFYIKNHKISDRVVLKARNICLKHPTLPGRRLLDDVSFDLYHGEVLGVFGLLGAGRTELLETLFGLHSDRGGGRIEIDGVPCALTSPQRAIADGLALVPEDRKSEGLLLDMTVNENMSLSCLQQFVKYGFINDKATWKLSEQYIQKLNIKTPSQNRAVNNLSGGNQQKVVLAKWLATQPKVLLLDEPTRGIDINAKNEIYQLINHLAQQGLGIVMVSSELPEILAICDRIFVLAAGVKTGEYPARQASEKTLLKAAIPSYIKAQ